MASDPVLLIHGVGSSYEHNWRATGWVDLLEGEGREVVGIELPGHGLDPSAPSEDPAEVLLRSCPLDAQVDAVGFSAGGVALLAAAARRPEAFRRIAVLGVGDPAATGDRSDLTAILLALEGEDEPAEGPARIIRRLVDSAGNDRFAVAAFLRSQRPPLSIRELGQIAVPTLVVIGEEDFVGPADPLIAALPTAELVTLHGTDHFATPSNFHCIDAVLRFLAD